MTSQIRDDFFLLTGQFLTQRITLLDNCLPGETYEVSSKTDSEQLRSHFVLSKTLMLNGDQTSRASLECAYRVKLAAPFSALEVEATSFSIRYRQEKRPVPIVRVEFERDAHSKPKTHFHTHSDSVPFALLLARAGLHRQAGHQQDVHFPMGGPYFRVCLEDMIELSITELGATGLPGWEEHVARGRHQYWQTQIESLMDKELPAVIKTLRTRGFTVTPPPGIDPEPLNA